MGELIALFLVSFMAATIFPAQSEAVLISMKYLSSHNVIILVAIASLGNVLGAIFNYILGWNIAKIKTPKFIKISQRKMEIVNKLYNRWGKATLLFSWLPIIGDAFTVIAGIFRINFYIFFLLVFIAKTARYIFLVAVF